MKDTSKILTSLRRLMQSRSLGAYIVPTDDAHQSEYIGAHDERRAYISGFDGSAGTAVVTLDAALLWTDGRYYQQAELQLGANWRLMRSGLVDTPTMGDWLAANLPAESIIGFDPKLISFRAWKPLQQELEAGRCKLEAIEENLVDLVWQQDGQPSVSTAPIVTHDLKFAGATIGEKCVRVRAQMAEQRTQVLVVSALDEIAWLLNLRGSDIDYDPVFFAYLIVTANEIRLFVDAQKLPANIAAHWSTNEVSVSVQPYAQIGQQLEELVSTTTWSFWISPTSSHYLNALVPKKRRYHAVTPITLNKAIKNATEAQGFISSHVRDGVALCQYFAWLEDTLNKGSAVDEITGADKLEQLRASKEHFVGLSFPTISAAGPNGSIIHYKPTQASKRPITKDELYLCDSGAQYRDGTTDVTRTWHFGEPSEFQQTAYTRVLKGQLTLGSAIFPVKTKGAVLDVIARKSLWDVGLDYAHGTGHGVGHFLNVHEGPMGIGFRPMPDDPGLQANMFISNEPGYYEDGEFGIRIEDIVQIVPTDKQYHFGGRGALTFKTITLCPKQTKLVKKEMLSATELKLLNDYHQEVWRIISPLLQAEKDELTLAWLQRETQPL